ncbi:MAG: hypothetical protein ACR2FN_05945 [Chitinophagaceae bacterium]
MRSKQTISYVLIAALFIVIGFQQCRIIRNGQIPIRNQDSVKAHVISIDSAAHLTANFRQGKILLARQLRDPNYLEKNFNMPNAENFNRDAIAALLNAQGAVGIRIYLGKDDAGLVRLVLIPTDAKGEDIIGRLVASAKAFNIPGVSSANAQGTTNAQAIENGGRCPTQCSIKGPLNQ